MASQTTIQTSVQASRAQSVRVSGGKSVLWQKAVTLALALLLCVLLARLVMILLVADPISTLTADTASSQIEIRQIDIGTLQAGRLFGASSDQEGASQSAQQRVASLPPAADNTALNLRLDGVVTGSSSSSGFAIIASNGRPATFRIGERLPTGNRVVLDSIYSDRVILENNGRMETLWLYAKAKTNANSGASLQGQRVSATTTSLAPDSQLPIAGESYNPLALINGYREKYLNNALSADFLTLSEIVKISPAQENSQLLGYRVSPGEYRTEFMRLGLKTNDIVTSINGIELTDIGNMPRLFEEMSRAGNISLSLLREGQQVDMQLTLTDLPKQQ